MSNDIRQFGSDELFNELVRRGWEPSSRTRNGIERVFVLEPIEDARHRHRVRRKKSTSSTIALAIPLLLTLTLPACGTGMRALRQPAAEHEVQLVEVFESCFDEDKGPGEGRCTRQNATIAIVQACLVTEAANLRSEERCMKMLEDDHGNDNE